MSNVRTVVYGTTADYIKIMNGRFPGRCLFITDPGERARHKESTPDDTSELLCNLDNLDETISRIDGWRVAAKAEPSGIVAFDDESMANASLLARHYRLKYVSPEAVAICRNKFETKRLWASDGLPCPETAMVESATEAVEFLEKVKQPVVIKPLTGSGSELTFLCKDRYECLSAFMLTRARLLEHANYRMFGGRPGNTAVTTRAAYEIETYISGREYSCDFIIDGDLVEIIRIARKIHASDQPFGTTLAYLVPAKLPGGIEIGRFRKQIRRAAQVLGINRSICMLDFIVHEDAANMLEIAPRPGGDCLPFLIKQSSDLDVLGLALDFADGITPKLPDLDKWINLAAVRIFAKEEGTVAGYDDSALGTDTRVKEIYYKHSGGHKVILPPEDYDSRILGHIIFSPTGKNVERECLELSEKLVVKMEKSRWATATGS